MGIEINYLSLPDNCPMLESAKRDEDQARWLSWIPIFLSDLEGKHPSELSETSTPKRSLHSQFYNPNVSFKQFYAPHFAPFRQIWREYTILCEKYPGLETRYCETSKDWLRLLPLLPEIEIPLHGSMVDLSSEAIFGTEPVPNENLSRYNPAGMVFEIAVYLNHITIEQLDQTYARLREGGFPDGLMDTLKHHFIRLQEFYSASAEQGEAVIIRYWG